MSLGRSIDHWGTGQKKDLLERLEKLQAQQAALKLRCSPQLATSPKRPAPRTPPGGCGPSCSSTRPWRARRLRLRTQLDSLAQPRKLSAENKGRKAPYDRLLGQAFARVVETYDVDQLPRHGGHGTTVFITMSVEDLRKDLGTAGWPATRTSSPSCSAPTPRSSTSAAPPGWRIRSNTEPSGYAISVARPRTATHPRPGPRLIT